MEAEDHILMAKAIKLKVEYVLKHKGHDRMFVENEIAAIVHLLCRVPSVNAELTRGSSVQTQAHNFRVVEARDVSEPGDQIGATRDAGVDCLDVGYVLQTSNPVRLVK